MASATLADPHIRQTVYRRLARRNQRVRLLRILVPGIGLLTLFGFAIQLYLAGQGIELSASAIRFDRGAVVVDSPVYRGTIGKGDTYEITAERADSNLNAPNRVALSGARLDLARADGTHFRATAARADYDLSAQTVTVSGVMHIADSRGVTGTLGDVAIDWTKQTLTAGKGVDLKLADGTVLSGTMLTYSGAQQSWRIEQAVLTAPNKEGNRL